MELVIQTFTNVLILAAMYILVSLGFAFLFNMLGFFNIAHGSIYMAAAYFGFLFMGSLGINRWLGFAIVIILIAILGIFLERFLFRPFLRDFNGQIMICVAITVILTTTLNVAVGSRTYMIPALVDGSFGSGVYSITWQRIVAFAIGAIVLLSVLFFVNRTRWGQQMLAISQNMEAASLQGINIYRVAMIVCALGCGLAAIAGILVGSMYVLSPFMGDNILIKILALVILAGAGSFKGVFYMGLILGTLYAVLPILLPGTISDAVARVSLGMRYKLQRRL
jgi:branched-subunit amino acid ABC-type transport system permease component